MLRAPTVDVHQGDPLHTRASPAIVKVPARAEALLRARLRPSQLPTRSSAPERPAIPRSPGLRPSQLAVPHSDGRSSHLQHAAVTPEPIDGVPPIVHDVLRTPGQPLGPATCNFMETRFGHD